MLTSVTLRFEPSLRLHAVEEPQPVEELPEHVPQLAAAHEHFEAFIFPYATFGLARWSDRTDQRPSPGRHPCLGVGVVIANQMFEGLLAAGRAAPALVPALSRVAAAAASGSDRVRCRTAMARWQASAGCASWRWNGPCLPIPPPSRT